MLGSLIGSLAILVASGLGDAPLVVTKDTVLDPAKTYGAIVVKSSGVTIDGRGACLTGPGGASPREFQGEAITADGAHNVTIKNLRAKGWETGLYLRNATGWTVESCDFSDNFHDPEFGWGEQGRRGGIVLEKVDHSTFRANKANRVWDACVLVDSHENTLADNDFSHTSNTGLKLWNSCRNSVLGNNLSYGLRIKTGEVHARDSAGLLIESGSNDNIFSRNNCTHGGDGVFIRVLNGWVSSGNVFKNNDASYANNNGFEAWAPRNIYRNNKANHCSYGFWLGASDGTILDGNEASHNGEPSGFHNSPHLPDNGHAGIVFMFGSSSHTVARNNRCQFNNGAGIAILGDEAGKGKAWKAYHWILENNILTDNRWGLYVRYADWLDLAGNTITRNDLGNFVRDETVTNVFEHPASPPDTAHPRAEIRGPSVARVGQAIALDASPSAGASAYRWDLGDGTIATSPKIEHVYTSPGFYRVGMTATDGRSADLAWRDLYVVDDRGEVGTEGPDEGRWSWSDPASKVAFSADETVKIAGSGSIRAEVNPYGGGRVTMSCRIGGESGLNLAGKTSVDVWIRTRNPNLPAWQGPNPVVSVSGEDGRAVTFTPQTDLLASPPYNEAREGWTRFVVPLSGGDGWTREGEAPASIRSISLGFDSWGSDPFAVWLDGLLVR